MNIISGIFLIIGLASLLYYGVIISYAGIHSSFSWIWLLAGAGSIMMYFIIRYILKHEKSIPKQLRLLSIIIILVGISVFSLIEGMIIFKGTQTPEQGRDYLIVLGAQVRGTHITKSLKKRLDTAIVYLQENKNTKAIVSGGKGTGEDISEAEAMGNYLIENGISSDRIIQENKSTNTNENILYSRQIMNDPKASVVIVTNRFHIFRSTSIAKKQGMEEVQGLAAPSDHILFLNYYVREVFGVIKDKVKGNL